jgi:hypothetical protein
LVSATAAIMKITNPTGWYSTYQTVSRWASTMPTSESVWESITTPTTDRPRATS